MGQRRNDSPHIEKGTKDGPTNYVRETTNMTEDEANEREEPVSFEYYVGETGRGWGHRSTYTTEGGTKRVDRGGITYAEKGSEDKFERRKREREMADDMRSQGLNTHGGR